MSRFDFLERNINSHKPLRFIKQVQFDKLTLNFCQITKPKLPTVILKSLLCAYQRINRLLYGWYHLMPEEVKED